MRWTDALSKTATLKALTDLALEVLAPHRGSTRSDELAGLISGGRWDGVVDYELSYDEDLSVSEALSLRQALAFFQKNRAVPLKRDREAVAWGKFVEAEEACAVTNRCFAMWESGGFQFHPRVEAVLHGAQRKISDILGDAPTLADLRLRFGPGATTDVRKSEANPRKKFQAGVACSASLLPYAPALLREMPGWLSFLASAENETAATVPVRVSDGRLSFVPKSAKTDRAIVVEPSLNGTLQLALGDYMAGRLLRVGVNLKDQTRNQRLARQGSLRGDLATLDLSSASDTVSRKLVEHLFPLDWLNLLSAARSTAVEYKGNRITLQKFSSMGNGYTFALETAIFYALAVSACAEEGSVGEVSVYGDDIIVPSSAAPRLIEALRAVGFSPNPSKSFWEGSFRESCGKDYFRGIDIRPVYVDDVLRVCDLFVLHNFFVATYQMDIADRVLGFIPDHLRIWGPPGFGDGHLHTDDTSPLRRSNRLIREGWGGFFFDTFVFGTRTDRDNYPADYLVPAYSAYTSPGGARADEFPCFPAWGSIKALANRRKSRDGFLASIAVRPSPMVFDRKGRFAQRQSTDEQDSSGEWRTPLPGCSGYSRRSIYILNLP